MTSRWLAHGHFTGSLAKSRHDRLALTGDNTKNCHGRTLIAWIVLARMTLGTRLSSNDGHNSRT